MQPHLAPRLKKNIKILLLPLWGFVACLRVTFSFTSTNECWIFRILLLTQKCKLMIPFFWNIRQSEWVLGWSSVDRSYRNWSTTHFNLTSGSSGPTYQSAQRHIPKEMSDQLCLKLNEKFYFKTAASLFVSLSMRRRNFAKSDCWLRHICPSFCLLAPNSTPTAEFFRRHIGVPYST
jgi:hypothetical protein